MNIAATRAKTILLFLFAFIVQQACGNINAIDFSQVKYPKELQEQVIFLRSNDGIYNHWVHDWTDKTPKTKVIENLTFLYTELDKLPKNVETDLLLGDIAHYLYNMEVEAYYQKAVDNYLAAKALAPKDYRVYWFLGNHYSLSANQVLSIQTYQTAMQYLPSPTAHALFWADYSIACANASMMGTAKYAAHQASVISGTRSYIEDQILTITNSTIKTPHLDTTLKSTDIWGIYGTQGSHFLINNWIIGTNLSIDSTWNYQVGDFKNRQTYITIQPNEGTAKNGAKIGYTILLLSQVPKAAVTLSQFLSNSTSQYKNKKPVNFTVGNVKNCVAYEIKDPSVYQRWGGGHMYAIAFERNAPAFPGMALETPVETPKNGGNEVTYYRAPQKFGRLKSRIYYLILLDSCEYIHAESAAVFKSFLDSMVIE
jgi:hypothetical protein